LSTVETTDESSTERQDASANRARAGGLRRRRLSEDEKLEIARLYADTSTPTAEIRERFGIGESSLYRVVQGHGVALRGRRGQANGVPPTPPAPSKPTRGRAPRAIATPRTAGAAQQQFRSQFHAETVLQANDLRGALRQAESLGAIDITAVVRQD
jgi:transposase-like protein